MTNIFEIKIRKW